MKEEKINTINNIVNKLNKNLKFMENTCKYLSPRKGIKRHVKDDKNPRPKKIMRMDSDSN